MTDIRKVLDFEGLKQVNIEIDKKDAAVLAAAEKFATDLGVNYDAAGAAASVKTELQSTIDGLSEVYDAKGAAAAVDGKLTNEVNRATAKEAEIVASVEAVDAKAVKNAEDIAAINNETTGILAQAKADATTKANAVQANVDALSGKVGNLPEGTDATSVVDYIDKKTANIASDETVSALDGRVTEAEKAIDAIEADYLKAADKTELEGKVTAEETARIAADEALAADIKAISDDYLKAADKTELTQAIEKAKTDAVATVLGEGVDEDFDTLKEVAEWILSDTTGAAAMQKDVAQLKTDVDAVEGRMDTAEGDIAGLKTSVAGKVEQSAYNEKIAALEGADSGLDTRLKAMEDKFTGDGEGTVADQIADAATAAKDAAIEAAAADATSKANAAEANAKSHADGLNTAMNARVEALEAVDHEHANKALLDTYTQTEANLADAVAKKHEHANKAVLDGIDANKVAAWDAAEGNAKTYADGLNTAMTTKVDAIDGRLATAESAVATKAEDADLDAAVDRITANETAIAANTAALAGIVRITEEEITAIFA